MAEFDPNFGVTMLAALTMGMAAMGGTIIVLAGILRGQLLSLFGGQDTKTTEHKETIKG